MTVYISGPISNDPDHAEKFAVAFVDLIGKGHTPINPVYIGRELKAQMGREPTWEDYMRECIKALCDCDAICMLPGWNGSKGALMEHAIAFRLGIQEYN
jgi:hypothetical protein